MGRRGASSRGWHTGTNWRRRVKSDDAAVAVLHSVTTQASQRLRLRMMYAIVADVASRLGGVGMAAVAVHSYG